MRSFYTLRNSHNEHSVFWPLSLPQTAFTRLYSILRQNPESLENTRISLRVFTAFYTCLRIRILHPLPQKSWSHKASGLFLYFPELISSGSFSACFAQFSALTARSKVWTHPDCLNGELLCFLRMCEPFAWRFFNGDSEKMEGHHGSVPQVFSFSYMVICPRLWYSQSRATSIPKMRSFLWILWKRGLWPWIANAF